MATPRKQRSASRSTDLRILVEDVEREHKVHIDVRLVYHRSLHRSYKDAIHVEFTGDQAEFDGFPSVWVREYRDARRWPVLEDQMMYLVYRAQERWLEREPYPGKVKPLFPDWQPKQ